MPISSRIVPTLRILAIVALSLSACGSNEGKTVATVGKTKVSQATLSHWMTTTLGGDYQAALGQKAPLGLVSDPADYDRCVSAAQGIVPQQNRRPKLGVGALRLKCRQLNTAIKEQALSYVISVLWRIEEGAELGIKAGEREISRELRRFSDQQYRSPAQFRRYLADRLRTIADERYLLKRNLLNRKFRARLRRQTEQLGGGLKAEARALQESIAKWTAKTSCSPGYLAWQCKQYGSYGGASPSAAVVLENLSKGV